MNGQEECAVKRELQVIHEIKVLEDVVERLVQTKNRLEDRLCFVSKPSAPIASDITKQPEQFVPLAEKLNSISSRVSNINYMLDGMIQRLEI